MIKAAVDLLLSAQNEDGGWGAVKGKRSNTESTSFALMALKSLEEQAFIQQTNAALKWLVQHQKDNGSWSLNDVSKQSSWTTPLAVLALLSFQDQKERALRGGKWILTQEGRKPGWIASLLVRLSLVRKSVELDPFLSGWSWTAGAFSWVEPTSYSLMVLKKLKRSLTGTNCEERIRQGEMLVYDRMCENGGWNYGNSRVLGEALWPYPDVTAVALIALQDRATNKANQKSLQALDGMMRETASGMTLGWGIICLTLYDQDAIEWKRVLVKIFEKTRFLGEIRTVALALLASGNGASLFRI
ncbi:MAG TPA: prenyltransferase/squalene oxidase repeat-containing protein [Candidatus Binatia bacterium]|nr:prenyltransferase/squalene oxidase repeat-containing protein [Candidatus Binatia bacterium]